MTRENLERLRDAYYELLSIYIASNAKRPGETTEIDLLLWINEQAAHPERWADVICYSRSPEARCAHCGKPVPHPHTHLCDAERMEHDR